MAVWTGYEQNGQNNYMLGDTTKIAQLMFKSMMQALGTDPSSFSQPASVYKVNNELYIKGVDSAEVPTIPNIIKDIATPNEGKNENKEKQQPVKEKGKSKDKGKQKDWRSLFPH